jgi:hypothetical protein
MFFYRDAMRKNTGAKLLDKFLQSGSSAALAYEIRVDPSYICHLRRGRRSPSLAVAFDIEMATGGIIPVSSWAR